MLISNSLFTTNNININIKYVLFADHDNNWYEVKAKNEYAFWIITSGSLNIRYANKDYSLSAGDIFFFYPDILYNAYSTTGCTFTFLHFNAILGSNYHALHFYPFDGLYQSEIISPLLTPLTNAITALHNNTLFAEFALQGELMAFLAKIMQKKYKTPEKNSVIFNKSSLSRLQPVLIYINNHLTEPIHINDLASLIHLSEKYFITFFRNTMGITPTNYIIDIKMKKALEYLNEQHFSVKEVSAMVGYSDIYAFSKAFKKKYGITPSKF